MICLKKLRQCNNQRDNGSAVYLVWNLVALSIYRILAGRAERLLVHLTYRLKWVIIGPWASPPPYDFIYMHNGRNCTRVYIIVIQYLNTICTKRWPGQLFFQVTNVLYWKEAYGKNIYIQYTPNRKHVAMSCVGVGLMQQWAARRSPANTPPPPGIHTSGICRNQFPWVLKWSWWRGASLTGSTSSKCGPTSRLKSSYVRPRRPFPPRGELWAAWAVFIPMLMLFRI